MTAAMPWQRQIEQAGERWDGMLERVAAARAIYEDESARLVGPSPVLHQVEDVGIQTPAGELPVRVFRPRPAPEASAALAFFHGGGWTIGSIDTHDKLCRQLALAADAVVVSVGYRLAPEHPHPAALDDAEAALGWMRRDARRLGIDHDRLAVGGDSAGGNLAAALAARDRANAPRLRFQLLLYPALDGRADTASWRELAQGTRLELRHHRWFYARYAGSARRLVHPEVSPALAEDVRGLPPALVIVGDRDPLRSEGEEYAARLLSAGVQATIRRYPGMEHGFLRFDNLPAQRDALDHAGAALRQHLECHR